MSSENITERYVKAHVVVKLQQEHKLTNTKAHVACNKKPQKVHVSSLFVVVCNEAAESARREGG